jgi:hypothetical protein
MVLRNKIVLTGFDCMKYYFDCQYLFQLPPDYYKIVKRPMWLEWIARKLAERAYSHLREFVHDVKRIFWNCHLYNKVDF